MIKYKKTNIISCQLDDIVKDLKELREKSKFLDGNLYEKGMLILVKEKNAIYKIVKV